MQRPDLALLVHDLQRYYGPTYHGMTSAMVDLWLTHLQPYPPDVALLAVQRWAAAHLPEQPPTLMDLVGVMGSLQQERRQVWTGAMVTMPPKETC